MFIISFVDLFSDFVFIGKYEKSFSISTILKKSVAKTVHSETSSNILCNSSNGLSNWLKHKYAVNTAPTEIIFLVAR